MQGRLEQLPPILKLVLLLTLVLLCGSISSLIMGLIAKPIFNVDIQSVESMYGNIAFMQTFQILQSISLFVLPSLLAFRFFYSDYKLGINGPGKITFQLGLITLFLIFISQAFIGYSAWVNHQLQLPEFMSHTFQWMVDKEAEAGDLTNLMIQRNNWWQIALTFFMMSIIPAIGEEWLFRGLMQRELSKWLKNHHIAIVISAIIFSAIHMQFLTFLPRFILGIILGYLFVLSGNLWVAVLAHFFNNFLAVVVYIRNANDNGEIPLDIPEDNPFNLWVILSLLMIVACFYFIRQLAETDDKQAYY